MTTILVTRHAGARSWAIQQGLPIDRTIDHMTDADLSILREGDVVVGTLPIQLAAAVCDSGARYLHLTLDIPPKERGHELSSEFMTEYGARIEEYSVRRVER